MAPPGGAAPSSSAAGAGLRVRGREAGARPAAGLAGGSGGEGGGRRGSLMPRRKESRF